MPVAESRSADRGCITTSPHDLRTLQQWLGGVFFTCFVSHQELIMTEHNPFTLEYFDLLKNQNVDLVCQPEQFDSDLLKPLAFAFAHNIDDIRTTLRLPAILLGLGDLQVSLLQQEFPPILYRIFSGEMKPQEEWEKEGIEAGEKVVSKIVATGDMPVSLERITQSFNALSASSQFSKPIKVIYKSALVSAWTTLESLTADIWEAFVNKYPATLAQNILAASISKDDSDSEITSKHVKLSLLKRYEYDLSKHMGTILKDKYDFTGIRGVRIAYTDAFGKSDANLISIFNDPNLSSLEVFRHNIVHRGGIVDNTLLRRLDQCTDLALVKGEEIPLSGKLLSSLLETTTNTGISLLKFTDNWAKSMA